MAPGSITDRNKAALRSFGVGVSQEMLIESACKMLDDTEVTTRFEAAAELAEVLMPHLNTDGVRALGAFLRKAELDANAHLARNAARI